MKALVTGAGMVGTAIARRLDECGDDVTVFDVAPEPADVPGRYVRGDLRDGAAVRDAARGAEGIFHTAALHAVHFADFSSRDFMDVNVTGTYNVLDAAVECGVSRVVHCSTLGVWFGSPLGREDLIELDDGEMDENRLARELYGLTKVLNEHTLDHFHANFELDVVALRYAGIWELVRRFFPDDAIAWATGLSGITTLDDVVASQVAAMVHTGPLPRRTYTICGSPIVGRRAIEAAGGDVRAAVVAKHPELADALPDPLASLPGPRCFVDTAPAERDLGIALTGHAQRLLREALREIAPTDE